MKDCLCVVVLALAIWLNDAAIVKDNVKPAIIEDLRSNVPSRVVGGWPAETHQIPHQINLRMVSDIGGVSSCGGSIIHHEWVLTAAHCVANRASFVIRFGLTNLTRPEFMVDTTRYYIHPNYIEAIAGVQTDDIALIGLEQHVPYSNAIKPIRLMSSEQKNDVHIGTVFTVSGFGLTDDAVNGGTTSEILIWTHLRGISTEECSAWYGGSSVIQEQTICAEYYNHTSQSSCSGDSGGPLTFVDRDGELTEVGIVSFGSSAGCNSVYPSAYVRPGHYHEWFTEITGINFDWSWDDVSQTTTGAPGDNDDVTDVDVATLPGQTTTTSTTPGDLPDNDGGIGVGTLPGQTTTTTAAPSTGEDDDDDVGIATLPGQTTTAEPTTGGDEDDDVGIATLPGQTTTSVPTTDGETDGETDGDVGIATLPGQTTTSEPETSAPTTEDDEDAATLPGQTTTVAAASTPDDEAEDDEVVGIATLPGQDTTTPATDDEDGAETETSRFRNWFVGFVKNLPVYV